MIIWKNIDDYIDALIVKRDLSKAEKKPFRWTWSIYGRTSPSAWMYLFFLRILLNIGFHPSKLTGDLVTVIYI